MVLDLSQITNIGEYTHKTEQDRTIYYKGDKLHMNEAGYRKIGPVQAAFLANGR